MKVWRHSWYDHAGSGQRYDWSRNKDEAVADQRRTLRQVKGGANVEDQGIEAIDFPTKKDALVDWLNENFSTDNG